MLGGGGVRQSGEAGQAVMCWDDGVPGRQGRQAGEASQARPVRRGQSGRHVLGGGVPGRQGRQVGKASQAVMCWGGGVLGRKACIKNGSCQLRPHYVCVSCPAIMAYVPPYIYIYTHIPH